MTLFWVVKMRDNLVSAAAGEQESHSGLHPRQPVARPQLYA